MMSRFAQDVLNLKRRFAGPCPCEILGPEGGSEVPNRLGITRGDGVVGTAADLR
jgi:hypothetical protein